MFRQMLPNFVVIGTQKSASTYIMNCMAKHPDIYMYPDEVTYFENPDYKQIKLSCFLELFENVKEEKAVGFKRPSYLAKPECAERLKMDLPSVKLIAVLRNPIERAVSAYFHYMKSGLIPIEPISMGMSRLLEGAYDTQYPASREIVEFGFYAKQLNHYFNYFDRDEIFILLYDDIRAKPDIALKNVYEFLGVPSSYRPEPLTTKPMASTNSLVRLRIGLCMSRLWMRYSDDRTRLIPRASLLSRFFGKSYSKFDQVVLAKMFPNQKPFLTSHARQQLEAIYKEDVQELEHLIDKDLHHWLS